MRKIFEEYGDIIVIVAAICALIGLVTILMLPGGVVDTAFGNMVNSFANKSEDLTDQEPVSIYNQVYAFGEGSEAIDVRFFDFQGEQALLFFADGTLLDILPFAYEEDNIYLVDGENRELFGTVSADGRQIIASDGSILTACNEQIAFGQAYSVEDGGTKSGLLLYKDGSASLTDGAELTSTQAGSLDYKNGVVYGVESGETTVVGCVLSNNRLWYDNVIFTLDPFFVFPSTFKLYDEVIVFDEGMTWADWVASDYNASTQYKLEDIIIQTGNGVRSVSASDAVVSNGEYMYYAYFVVDSSNRGKIGYTGEANENLVIPAAFYDEEDGKYYRVVGFKEASFSYCTNLKSVTLPDGVAYISQNMFTGCDGLTSVKIPDSVLNIYGSAFSACSSLTSIGPVGSGADIELPYTNPLSISAGAFSSCSSLKSVVIPDGVSLSSAGSVFRYCSALESVVLSDDTTVIGAYTFHNCALKSITISDSVTRIGIYAFYGCDSLANITFEGTVEQWNNITFEGDNWHTWVPATEVACSDGTVKL